MAHGYDESWEVLKARARNNLRDQICQGILCNEIAREINDWKIGEASNGLRCAMAIIDRSSIDDWAIRASTPLKKRFTQSTKVLLEKLAPGTRITVGVVRDEHLAGGVRAMWAYEHIKAALNHPGHHLIKLKDGWHAPRPPKDVDVLVTANISSLENDIISIRYEFVFSDGEILSGDEIRIHASLGPIVSGVSMPAFDRALNVRETIADIVTVQVTNTLSDGSMCAGASSAFDMALREDRYVRVYNVDTQGVATQVYPLNKGDARKKKPGDHRLFSFDIQNTHVERGERFIVLTSQDADALGQLRESTGFCRVPAKDVLALRAGNVSELVVGEVEVMSVDYRVVPSNKCDDTAIAKPLSEVQRARQKKALEQAPDCW